MTHTTKKAGRFEGREHGVIPTRAGTYLTPVAFLETTRAQAWSPSRLPPIERAHDEGHGDELPAITIVFYPDGHTNISDGNHRLFVARAKGAERMLVTWKRAYKGSRWRETPTIGLPLPAAA